MRRGIVFILVTIMLVNMMVFASSDEPHSWAKESIEDHLSFMIL